MDSTILQYALHYFSVYQLPQRCSAYHHIISLIVSQQIKFESGRQVRKTLYERAGFPLTPINVSKLDLTNIKYLTPAKIFTIKSVTDAALEDEFDLIFRISYVKGIGSWTVKGAYILTETSFYEALYEDSYIKKRLGEILTTNIQLRNCKEFFERIPENNRSVVSYFLWRIKKSGCEKVRNGLALTRDDFL